MYIILCFNFFIKKLKNYLLNRSIDKHLISYTQRMSSPQLKSAIAHPLPELEQKLETGTHKYKFVCFEWPCRKFYARVTTIHPRHEIIEECTKDGVKIVMDGYYYDSFAPEICEHPLGFMADTRIEFATMFDSNDTYNYWRVTWTNNKTFSIRITTVLEPEPYTIAEECSADGTEIIYDGYYFDTRSPEICNNPLSH
jgi:hypothetical protein